MKAIIITLLIPICITLSPGQSLTGTEKTLSEMSLVDTKNYRIDIQPNPEKFCFADSHVPWRHLIYYTQSPAINDIDDAGGEIITVTIIDDDSKYFLLFFDQRNQKFQHGEFDQLPNKRKISEANASRQLDVKLTEILYETWVNVLLTSQFPSTGLIHANGDFYRISSYISSFDKRFITAQTSVRVKGSHVDLIVGISHLLVKLVHSKSAEESTRLEEEIIKLCRTIRSDKKSRVSG